MKKLPMILLPVLPWIILILCGAVNMDLRIGLCIYTGLCVFNIVYAFWMPRLGFSGKQILFWNLLLKLCNIPLILLVCLTALVTTLIGGAAMRDMAPTVLLTVLLFCALVQLSSTAFGLSGFRVLRKSGRLSAAGAIWRSVLQFLPCIDVIGAVVCFILLRSTHRRP